MALCSRFLVYFKNPSLHFCVTLNVIHQIGKHQDYTHKTKQVKRNSSSYGFFKNVTTKPGFLSSSRHNWMGLTVFHDKSHNTHKTAGDTQTPQNTKRHLKQLLRLQHFTALSMTLQMNYCVAAIKAICPL